MINLINIRYAKPINVIFRVFLLQTLFVMLAFSTCMPYFSAKDNKRSIKTITANNGMLPSFASYYYIWSDNDEYHLFYNSNIVDKQKILSRYFVAFYIPVLDIVTQQNGQYTPSELNLDNLLYANLRIERLMNEYSRLKTRSKPTLEGLDVPYTSWKLALEKKLSEKRNTISDKINNNNLNKRKYVRNKYNGIKLDDRTGHGDSEKSWQTEAREPLYNINRPLNSLTNYKNQNTSLPKNKKSEAANSTLDQSTKKKDYRYHGDFDERILRILRFLVKLVNYAIDNKLVVFIYLFVLFGVYYIFFGIRKK